MGLGDQLMATGMAKGANARGKRIAFGDGRSIKWDGNSPTIFQGNPNIAKPGTEWASDLEWINFYKGSRLYNTQDLARGRWIWNYGFRQTPGEIYLTADEEMRGRRAGNGFIVIDTHRAVKPGSENRQWGMANWRALVERLSSDFRLVQFTFRNSGEALAGVEQIEAGFRDGLAILQHAALFVGGEGGLPHGAAAVGCKAVVIFGAWVPPQVTGYDAHVNIAAEDTDFCGTFNGPCDHCRKAMASISVEQVYEHVVRQMERHLGAVVRHADRAISG